MEEALIPFQAHTLPTPCPRCLRQRNQAMHQEHVKMMAKKQGSQKRHKSPKAASHASPEHVRDSDTNTNVSTEPYPPWGASVQTPSPITSQLGHSGKSTDSSNWTLKHGQRS